ncbi:MAG: NAD(P)H-binding protein [Solirubrobacterales bacterium]|nr:NAD(P)H-binding protein [Solirubrobacterales bacterium]
MRIAVLGANGRTGKLVVEQALARGDDVIALARNPDNIAVGHDHIAIQRADVLDPATLTTALAGADAVVSTLGIGNSRKPTEVYSAGIKNVLAAMDALGISRISVVSGSPAGPADDHPAFQRRIAMPILWRFFGASYADMRRMEDVLRQSSATWVSLRPPRLLEKRPKGHYLLGVKPDEIGRSIRYGDLATALLDVLDNAAVHQSARYISN